MTRTIATLAFTLFVWAPLQPAAGDIFVLKSGGQIEGELQNPDERPREDYVVKTKHGAIVTLAVDQVTQHVALSKAEQLYRAALPKMKDTPKAHWQAAAWCARHRMPTEREFHLRQVLRHDPDHVKARTALGYTLVNGQWIQRAAKMQARGFIYHRGRWMTPQELRNVAREDEFEAAEVQWRKDIRMWVSWLGRKRHEEALDKLAKIRDPRAAGPLVDMLKDEKDPRLRLLYIDILGKLRSSRAVRQFIRIALSDQVEGVRDAALRQLKGYGTATAAAAFAKHLDSKSNALVNRAAIALGRLEHPLAVPHLIQALVTEHKFTIRSGGSGSISPTFTKPGSGGSGGTPSLGGLTAGSSVKTIVRRYQNLSVLSALTKITGQNYGYDEARWQAWFVDEQTPDVVDLRRDP